MTNIVQAQANLLLNETLGVSSPTLFTGTAFLRLTTTAPTSTAAGTELAGGSGYTTGGTAITFSSASAGSSTGPSSQISWTNASGSTWSIVGGEIWDSAGTPLRWWWGLWNGQPITIANGNIFTVAINGITATLG